MRTEQIITYKIFYQKSYAATVRYIGYLLLLILLCTGIVVETAGYTLNSTTILSVKIIGTIIFIVILLHRQRVKLLYSEDSSYTFCTNKIRDGYSVSCYVFYLPIY